MMSERDVRAMIRSLKNLENENRELRYKEVNAKKLKSTSIQTQMFELNLGDAVQFIETNYFPLSEKGWKYLEKDFGELDEILIHDWPESIDQWMQNGSSTFSDFGCLTFRDAKFFRTLVKEGKKMREMTKNM